MSNLTTLQEKLVSDLVKEFSKINPKVTDNGTKRFTIASIDDCKREEERFLETIKKHNQTMIKVFEKQFKDELKEFTKEYGKVFNTQFGYKSLYNQDKNKVHHSFEEFIAMNKKSIIGSNGGEECQFFIASKTKMYGGDSGANYCGGKAYTKIYVDFNREWVATKLESGKEVYAYKIVGLSYSDKNYLYRKDSGVINSNTLDGFIQASKSTQRAFVEMAS